MEFRRLRVRTGGVPLALHVRRFHLVGPFPNFAQAYRGVEPVEDGERHRDVRYDRPRPQAVEVQLDGVRLRPGLLQGVDGPHRQVGHQQERDDLPAGLLADLLGGGARPPGRVQHEYRLARGLHEGRQGGGQHEHGVPLDGELPADDRERAVYEHARLRSHEQDVVQLEIPPPVVLQLPHLPHPYEGGERGEAVQGQLADVHLYDGEPHELDARYQHEEEYERYDGEHQQENAHEESLLGARAVDRVVVRAALVVELWFQLEGAVGGWELGYVAPHDVEDGGADEAVLYGTREEEGRSVLYQRADNVGASALVQVVGTFETPRDYVMTMGFDGVVRVDDRQPQDVALVVDSVRDTERVVLRVVEREDLVLGFLDENEEPYREVGADHVHEAESGRYLVLVNPHLLQFRKRLSRITRRSWWGLRS